jgi:hypothetical protein
VGNIGSAERFIPFRQVGVMTRPGDNSAREESESSKLIASMQTG